MSQYNYGTIDPATKTGTALATDLNSQRDAYHSMHSSTSAPSYVASGMLWLDTTTSTAWKVNFYDGTSSVELFSINSVAHSASMSASLSPSDINMSGSLELTTNGESITLNDATGSCVIDMAGSGYVDIDAVTGHHLQVGGTNKITVSTSSLTSSVAINAHTASTTIYSQIGDFIIGATSGVSGNFIAHSSFAGSTTSWAIKIGNGASAKVNLNAPTLGRVDIGFNGAGSGAYQFSNYEVSIQRKALFTDMIAIAKGSDIASATTITIPTDDGVYFDITGTTDIEGINATSISGGYLAQCWLQFDSSLTLVHSASFILPNGEDINVVSGDIAYFMEEGGGTWRCMHFQSAIPSGAGTGDMVLSSVQTNTGAKTFNDATLLLNNVAGTFTGQFTNTNTANRTYTLPDASGTLLYSGGALGTPASGTLTNCTGLPVSGLEPDEIKNETGTTYAPILTDIRKTITLNNSSPITVTIPANSSVAFPVGTKIEFVQLGSGSVTFGITTDTLNVDAGFTKVMNGQYSACVIEKLTSTMWVIYGGLTPA